MRPRALIALVLFAVTAAITAAVACASTARQTCPPTSVLGCLTPLVCDVDRMTGCRVCRCAEPPFQPAGR